jgi:hypothetical protein
VVGLTTLICLTVEWLLPPSVTVRRTHFVPGFWNVNRSTLPEPRDQLVPPAPSEPSSRHVYDSQGECGHVVVPASNVTCWPVCGVAGVWT